MIKFKKLEKFIEKATCTIEYQDKRIVTLYDFIHTLEGDEDRREPHKALLKRIDEKLSENSKKLQEAAVVSLEIYSDLRQKEFLSKEEVKAYKTLVRTFIDYQIKLYGLMLTKLDILETRINK